MRLSPNPSTLHSRMPTRIIIVSLISLSDFRRAPRLLTLLLLSGCSVPPVGWCIQCNKHKFICSCFLTCRWGIFPETHRSFSQSYWGKIDFYLGFYSVKDSVRSWWREIFCRIFKKELQNYSKVYAIFLGEFVIEMKEQRNNTYQARTMYQMFRSLPFLKLQCSLQYCVATHIKFVEWTGFSKVYR